MKPPIEKAFLAQVIQLARLRGWRVAHFRPARTAGGNWRTAVQGDGAGFPDLVLLRMQTHNAGVPVSARLIFAELKTQRGQLTGEQKTWLAALAATGAETYTWRPDQWNEIEEVLR